MDRVEMGEVPAMQPRSRKVELPSLEQHVSALIKQDILSGNLRPGTPLVEARLAEEFGVSKTPIREALIRLRLDGLVTIERFRGARVAEPSARDVQEICALRRWIEGGIAEELAKKGHEGLLASLRDNVKSSRRALASHDDRRYLDDIREFDQILARGSGNSWVVRILSDLYNVFGLIGAVSLDIPGRRERSIEEHAAILDAIAAGEPRAAVKATLAHIASIERDYLEAVGGGNGQVEPGDD